MRVRGYDPPDGRPTPAHRAPACPNVFASGRLVGAPLLGRVGGLLVLADRGVLPRVATGVAGLLVLAGTLAFAWNVLGVVRRHSPHTVSGLVLPALERLRSTRDVSAAGDVTTGDASAGDPTAGDEGPSSR